jgi:putative flippase GtrA
MAGLVSQIHNVQGGRDLSSVAGDISSAGAALAGLILVFLGHTAGTFENYGPSERKKVKDRLRKRAVLAFGGFVFALAYWP